MTISVSKPPGSGKMAISFDAEKNRFNEVRIRDDKIVYDKALTAALSRM